MGTTFSGSDDILYPSTQKWDLFLCAWIVHFGMILRPEQELK